MGVRINVCKSSSLVKAGEEIDIHRIINCSF